MEAKLNRTAFEQGDEAALELSSRRPAWVYVFNLMANDKAALLLPNRWQPDNRLQGGGRTLRFPGKDCGVCLEMAPLPGDPESAEAFLVVAFPKETSLAERFDVGHAYELTEFYRRLTAFPWKPRP